MTRKHSTDLCEDPMLYEAGGEGKKRWPRNIVLTPMRILHRKRGGRGGGGEMMTREQCTDLCKDLVFLHVFCGHDSQHLTNNTQTTLCQCNTSQCTVITSNPDNPVSVQHFTMHSDHKQPRQPCVSATPYYA